MEISVVGAFDRYNLGDLLFPIILKNEVEKRFGNEVSFRSFGIRKSSFQNCGGIDTEMLSTINRDSLIINAGGNTLVARIDYLYLDNIDNRVRFMFNRVIRKMIGIENYISYVQRKLNIQDRFPYDINANQVYYNSVGGNISNLLSYDRDYVVRVLSKAKYISVRDNNSQASCECY